LKDLLTNETEIKEDKGKISSYEKEEEQDKDTNKVVKVSSDKSKFSNFTNG